MNNCQKSVSANQNLDDLIFNFAYHMAMNDATMQKANKGKKRDIESNESVKDAVRKYITDIFDGKKYSFCDTADNVRKAVGDDKLFTFGNIQKLINMTAKYMYITCYHDNSKRNLFKNCHCPIDRNVIDTVYNKYKNCGKNADLLNYKDSGKQTSDKSKISWSNFSFEYTDSRDSRAIYDHLQEMISELAKKANLIPIEYDFKVTYPIED